MRWSNIRLIFAREVRDQLRDRRTLFMILVLPLVLYPAMGLGVVHMTALFTQQPQRVAIVGAEFLPENPPLVDRNTKRFDAQWFRDPADAEQLELDFENTDPMAVQGGEVQVHVAFPADTQEKLAVGEAIEPLVVRNSADERSLLTYGRVMDVLDQWQRAISSKRLAGLGRSADFANPVQTRSADVAEPEQQSASLWSKLFPFLLIIMTLTGAFYPAVDLCAGEKERGTMETLLISPAARSEIVLGKFCTIALFSMVTAVLNLLSMGLTGWHIASTINFGAADGQAILLGPPPAITTVWVLLLLPLLAAFFSALSLALAAFARSSKEGQYYLMPLFLITMPLTMLTVSPGVELNLFYSMLPVTGIALLFKSLLLMQYGVALKFALPVVVPTVCYSYMALRWAMEQFRREEVLFREAERLDLGLWLRHLLRDKDDTPSGAEAVVCFVLIMLILWFSSALLPRPSDFRGLALVMAISQIAFVATPALLMSVMLTRSPMRTLQLRVPRLRMLPVALVLAAVCHPLVVEIGLWVQFVLPLNEGVKQLAAELLAPHKDWLLQLLVVACLPAFCEEVAFRGFILSGLSRGHTAGRAVFFSSLFFALSHMLLQQEITTFLLGLVIGLLVVRSGSLFPAMLLHFGNNALALVYSGVGTTAVQQSKALRFVFRTFGHTGDGVAYQYHVLAVCAVVAGVLIAYLIGLGRTATQTPQRFEIEEPLVTAAS